MVGVMTMTPPHMKDHGQADLSAVVIAVHILGMFGLAPLVGRYVQPRRRRAGDPGRRDRARQRHRRRRRRRVRAGDDLRRAVPARARLEHRPDRRNDTADRFRAAEARVEAQGTGDLTLSLCGATPRSRQASSSSRPASTCSPTWRRRSPPVCCLRLADRRPAAPHRSATGGLSLTSASNEHAGAAGFLRVFHRRFGRDEQLDRIDEADLVREADADRHLDGASPSSSIGLCTPRRAGASRSRTRRDGRRRRAARRRRRRRPGRRRRSCGTHSRGDRRPRARICSAASPPSSPVIESMLSRPITIRPGLVRLEAGERGVELSRVGIVASGSSSRHSPAARPPQRSASRSLLLVEPHVEGPSRGRGRRLRSRRAACRRRGALARSTTVTRCGTTTSGACRRLAVADGRDADRLHTARLDRGTDDLGQARRRARRRRRRRWTAAQARRLPAAIDTEIAARTALFPALAMTRRLSCSGRSASTSISSSSTQIDGDVTSAAT